MKIIEIVCEDSENPFTKPKYSERRTKVLELTDDLIKTIRKECKETLDNDQYLYRGMYSPYNAMVMYGDSEKGSRVSANTENYYTLLMDEILPEWKNYPKRSKSFVCSSTERTAASYGNVFYVIPVGTPTIAICPDDDIWHSFKAFNHLPDLNQSFKVCGVDQDVSSLKKFIRDMNKQFIEYKDIIKNDITKYRETIKETTLGKFFSSSPDIMFKHTLPLVLGEYDSFMDWLETVLSPNGFDLVASNDYKEMKRSREVWFSGKAYFVTEEALYKIKNKKLTESSDDSGNDPKKLAAIIKDYCKPFLQQVSKGNYLFRGDTTAKGNFVIKEVRQDRKPRDTKLAIHDLFNRLIQQGGYKANRSNSLFTFGDIDNVRTFLDTTSTDDIFVCFPVGNFNYVWHRLYKDWTADIMDNFSDLLGKDTDIKHFLMYRTTESVFFNDKFVLSIKNDILRFIKETREMGVSNTVLDVFEKEAKEITTINDIRAAIRTIDVFHNSLTVDERTTIVETHDRFLKNILGTTRKFVFDDFVEYLEGDNGTLNEAIESGNEIMIHCKKVVMVQLDYFNNEIEKYL